MIFVLQTSKQMFLMRYHRLCQSCLSAARSSHKNCTYACFERRHYRIISVLKALFWGLLSLSEFKKIRKRTGFQFLKKIRTCLNYCGLDLGNHNKSFRLPSSSSIYWRSTALDSPNFCHLCSSMTTHFYCKI